MLKLVAAVVAGFATMGGWAVVTVQDLPEYFVAGRPYTIEFKIRQHGLHLLNNLEPELIVSTSAPRLGGILGAANQQRIPAKARPADGTYAATFTAPANGPLYLTILSSFGASNLRLYPAPVVAANATVPAIAIDRGRALFVAKGCNACHENADLVDRPDNQQTKAGPALGGHRFAREYVAQKIKNPGTDKMPNLGLSDAEVAAIATFLAGERTAASSR